MWFIFLCKSEAAVTIKNYLDVEIGYLLTFSHKKGFDIFGGIERAVKKDVPILGGTSEQLQKMLLFQEGTSEQLQKMLLF